MNYETRRLQTAEYGVFSDLRESAQKLDQGDLGILAVISKQDTVDFQFIETMMDFSAIRELARSNGWELSFYALKFAELERFKMTLIGPQLRD